MYNINIVNVVISCDDTGHITKLDIKFKNSDPHVTETEVTTVIFAALSRTTFFIDEVEKGFHFDANEKRSDLFNVSMKIRKSHNSDKPLNFADIGAFTDFLQDQITNTPNIF